MAKIHTSPALTASRVREERPARSLFYRLPSLLASALMLSGVWLALLKVFDGLAVPMAAVAAAGAAGLLAAFLYQPRRGHRIAAAGAAAVLLIFVLVFRARFAAGVKSCLTAFSARLTERTGYLYFGFEGGGDSALFLTVLSLLLGVLCQTLCRLPTPVPAVVCGFLFGLPCLFGFLEPGLWLAAGFSGCLLLLAVKAADGCFHPVSALPALVAAALAGIVLLSAGELPDGASQSVQSLFHRLSYEKTDNPLPEGHLKNLKPFRPEDDPALNVTMDHWTVLYLRGFVGERFTDYGWEPLKGETLGENAALLYNLQKSYFTPPTQLAAGERETGGETSNRVSVLPNGACRAYQYIPYGAWELEGMDPRALSKEGSAPGKGFETSLYPVENAYLTQAALSEVSGADSAYLDGEGAYRSFVYENDTAIPDTAYAQLAEHFPLGDTGATTTEAKRAVQEWLDSAMTYDESAVSGGGDFLRYLLEFDGRGYSVHYATMATLLLRAFGIPARYVEGYVVTSAEAAELNDGETFPLSQRNAHAWTEYYLDGVGWLPFDATPGYTEEIVYQLPESGAEGDGENQLTSGLVAELPRRNVQIDTSDSFGEESGPLYVFYALFGVALFLLLLLLALFVQSLVMRRRLKRRMDGFRTLPPGQGSADCFRYLTTVLRLCGVPEKNIPLTQRAEAIAETLELEREEDARKAVWLATEVWYSGHEISEVQRKQALSCLSYALQVWRRKTGFFRRLKERWIDCLIP